MNAAKVQLFGAALDESVRGDLSEARFWPARTKGRRSPGLLPACRLFGNCAIADRPRGSGSTIYRGSKMLFLGLGGILICLEISGVVPSCKGSREPSPAIERRLVGDSSHLVFL